MFTGSLADFGPLKNRFFKPLQSLADCRDYCFAGAKNPTLIIIEQVHHSHAPRFADPQDLARFTAATNGLQKLIFRLLQKLDSAGLDLLGIEDLSYRDHEEIDAQKATTMVKNSRSGTLSSWNYEMDFPDHYRVFCPDIINIGGLRRGVVFAAAKLLGRDASLRAEHRYFQTFFQENLVDLSADEEKVLSSKLLDLKKQKPQLSLTALFFALAVNGQVNGLMEALGEYYAAAAITRRLKTTLKEDFSRLPDSTAAFTAQIGTAFQKQVRELFQNAEAEQKISSFSHAFIELLNIVYADAAKAAATLERLLNQERSHLVVENCRRLLEGEPEPNMVLIFGAAHGPSLLAACREKGLNGLLLRPRHRIWSQVEI